MNLDQFFPRYTAYDPQVPVWCMTPNERGCIHRFFDTSPISPSGRYLAVFRLPFEHRRPRPGESGHVLVVDLATGAKRFECATCGWEPQVGANVNWGGTDEELFFNDVDVSDWRAFAWKANPLTGARQRMDGPVYHASPDGRWLLSADPAKMGWTQPGYGVVVPRGRAARNAGLPADDGFFLTDTRTGECRLFASIRAMVDEARPPVPVGDPTAHEIYGFHCKFNPQGNRVMMSLRWFPRRIGTLRQAVQVGRRRVLWALSTRCLDWHTHAMACKPVRFAWVTCSADGAGLRCAIGPEQWEKSGHHATWCDDGERISMNLDINREGHVRFVACRWDGSDIGLIRDDVVGSGHPTVVRDGQFILTDAYTRDTVAFGDGTVPLRWVDVKRGTERCLVRVNTATTARDQVLRVDPHPAWDRTRRYVVFNGFVGGTRRVFLADLGGLQP